MDKWTNGHNLLWKTHLKKTFYFLTSCRIETIDGGRIIDPSPFPSLRQIIRFQTMMRTEKDTLRMLTKNLYSGSKLSYLEDLLYPDLANKLQNIVRRTQLGVQLSLAEAELSQKKTTNKLLTPTTRAVTSYSTMSITELESWISEMKENAKTLQTFSFVRTGGPRHCLSLPKSPTSFDLSFVTYNDHLARLTCLQMERTRFLHRHPINLSSFACLGVSLPLAVNINALSGQQPLHSSDTVRESIALTPTIVDLMYFLSYGTYKMKATSKNNTITIDCATQTSVSCVTQTTETAIETMTIEND